MGRRKQASQSDGQSAAERSKGGRSSCPQEHTQSQPRGPGGRRDRPHIWGGLSDGLLPHERQGWHCQRDGWWPWRDTGCPARAWLRCRSCLPSQGRTVSVLVISVAAAVVSGTGSTANCGSLRPTPCPAHPPGVGLDELRESV